MVFEGLSDDYVAILNSKFGDNVLVQSNKVPHWLLYLRSFQNPIIYLLLIVSFITFIIGDYSDSIIIILITFINSLIGFYQELKAQKTIDSLKKLISLKSKVLRNGSITLIDAKEIVPGDVVYVESGDKIPCDGVFISAKNLQIVESQLTGESFPVEKNTVSKDYSKQYSSIINDSKKLDLELLIFLEKINNDKDISNSEKCFMSTLVNNGKGTILVTSTGMSTEIGKISSSIQEGSVEKTPLEIKFSNLTKSIILIVFIAIFSIFIIGIIKNISFEEIFKTSVSLGVSAIPEGLPIIMTVTLSIGGWRMAREKSVIKNLSSVSTLAGVTVICTDKTGTITEGNLALEKVIVIEENQNELAVKFASLCNDASIDTNNNYSGDLLDIAILKSTKDKNLDFNEIRVNSPRIDEIPFDSEYKYMATLNQLDGKNFLIVKGAPDILFSKVLFESGEKSFVEKIINEKNKDGFRTIILCYKEFNSQKISHEDIYDLKFLSVLSFIDPIRPDIAKSIESCRINGIRPILITGDNIDTAKYIAQKATIYDKTLMAITGEEFSNMSNEEILSCIDKISIIARATPQNKSRLVGLLQQSGEIVAMTGDGVNDGPALAKAEIGIAMGKNGTDVARDAADMVLIDDNFSTIVRGIEEARVVFENIKKVVSFLFSTSFGEILTILIAIILGLPLPLLAVQILWLNLVTDGFLDVALSTEKKESGQKNYSPSRYNSSLITRSMFFRIFYIGLIMAIGSILVFDYYLNNYDLEYARSAALLTMCMFQWLNIFNMRSENISIFKLGFLSNRPILYSLVIVILLMTIAIYFDPLQSLLSLVSLNPETWIIVFAVTLPIIIIEEIRKFAFGSKNKH